MNIRRWNIALGCCLLAGTIGTVRAQEVGGGCGNLKNGYGPYDYINERDKLAIVEPWHFPPEVEGLIRGKSGYLGGDIDYTLRASPNHHRALIAMMRLGERARVDPPPNATYTVECYFRRAVTFRPNDSVSRMLYANFLQLHGRNAEAAKHLERTLEAADDNAFTYYNAGLIYLDMKDYNHALSSAQRAYALGIQRPGLRDGLKAAGKWVEPPAPDQPDLAASSPPPTPEGEP